MAMEVRGVHRFLPRRRRLQCGGVDIEQMDFAQAIAEKPQIQVVAIAGAQGTEAGLRRFEQKRMRLRQMAENQPFDLLPVGSKKLPLAARAAV